ncbi:MAG: metallophosphoesterase [Byssovorax sp.]
MSLAWVTDIHLNFLDAPAIAAFCARIAATGADGVIVSGDISEAHQLANHLEMLAAHLARPVYFVIGNHDAYRGSIEGTKALAARTAASSPWLRYLPTSGVIAIDGETCLVGVDGWADTRLGDWAGSQVSLNDYVVIDELRGHTRAHLATTLQGISDAETALARTLLRDALGRFRRIVFVTHVPPFEGAAWHEGQISGADWLPHFSSRSMGEMLLAEIDARADRELLVLCGHTHGAGVYRPRANIEVRTGGADYGAPEIQLPLIT